MPASFPRTDGRGGDPHGGGRGFGGDDPLEILAAHPHRHWLATLLVASQRPAGLLVPAAGGDGHPKDL